jgi:hypothetical protein
MTGPDAGRLSPLPIRPRPVAGEPVSSYVRRLARANHLRPSYLHGYLAGPPGYLGAIQPGRLAILSGRSVAVLERTLTGLPRQTHDTTLGKPPPQPSRHVTRAAGKPGLFAAIRRDARDGTSIRALAGRYQVHRRTIRQALADPAPPPRKPQPRRATAFDRLHEPIAAMLTSDPGLTILQIWERLTDDHEAAIAYATVRDYVVTRLRRRHGQAATRQEQLRQPGPGFFPGPWHL